MRLRPSLTLLAAVLLSMGPLLAFVADEPPSGLLVALKGHKEPVYGITYSPDGKYLLSASGDNSLRVWQADTGKELKSFAGPNGHKGLVVCVAAAPDGTSFVSGGADNSLRFWDFPSAKHSREFAMASDSRCVAVSPDGTRLAGGGKDGKIRLWTSVDGKQLFEMAGHTGMVTALSFTSNGQLLASAGADGTLRYWNPADGKQLVAFGAHPGPITGLAIAINNTGVYTTGQDGTLRSWALPAVPARSMPALPAPASAVSFTPDGGQFVVAADKAVRVGNTTTMQTVRELAGVTGKVNAIAGSQSGTLVAAGTADRKLHLWQSKDGTSLMQPLAHGGAVTGVAFNPGGNQLASVGQDGVLRLWAVPPAPPRVLPHPEVVRAAVLSADGKRMVTGAADRLVRLYRLDNLKQPERQFTGHTGPVNAVSLSPDGKLVASAGDDEVIRLWNSTTGEQKGLIGAHAGPVVGLTFVGSELLLSASADGSVKVWQATAPAMRSVFSHAGLVTGLAVSPDGNRLLTGCADKQVRLWNLGTGQVERTWPGPALAVHGVAFSPGGDRVAAGSADKSVFVWETASSKNLHKIVNLPAGVQSLAWTADGKQIVAGLADGSVRLLDLASGKEVRALAPHKGAVQVVTLTARGDQVVSGGADGIVLVSNLAGGAPAGTWTVGTPVAALALSKDGTRAAVGGTDRNLRLITMATGKVESTVATPAEIRGVAFSADSKRIAVAGSDGKARLYNLAGDLEEHFNHDGAVEAIAFTPDGKRVVSAGADKTARAWTPALRTHLRHGAPVRQALLSARGDRIVSAGTDGMVRIWNFADGKSLSTLHAHTGGVSGIALSADGNRLASAGADKVARLWDLPKLATAKAGGKDLDPAQFSMPLPAPGEGVGLTADGKRLAVGVTVAGKDQVQLINAETGKDMLSLGEGEGLPARVVSFLADGRTLLVAGADRTARLVDVNLLATWHTHEGGASTVAYHPGGNQVVTGGSDKTAKLWNLTTGKLDQTFGPIEAPVASLALSRDGTALAAVAGKTLRVWTVAGGKELMSLPLPATATAVSQDSARQRIAVACEDGRARVFDLTTKQEVQSFLHQGAVAGLAFHPTQQQQLLTAGVDREVSLQQLSNRITTPAGASVSGVAASANGAQVLTSRVDGKVQLLNANSGALERACESGDKAQTCVAVTKTGTLIASGGIDKKVRIYNYADGKVLSTITTESEPRALAFSPTSQALVMAGADGSLVSWDVVYQPGQVLPAEFGKVLQSFRHAAEASDLAFPSAGQVFWSAGSDKTVKQWKLAADTPIRTIGLPNSVNAVAYNKDGSQVLSGCSDGKLRIHDTAKGTLLREISAHPTQEKTAIYAVAWSPDGKQVVSGSIDQSMKLFSATDGKAIREFRGYKEKDFTKGHQEAVLSVAFSPDGTQLASGGMDRSIKIWNVSDGNVIREFSNPTLKPGSPGQPPSAHPGWVYGVRWLDGGKKLLSAGQAPRLQSYLATWEVASGKLISGKELSIGSVYSLALSPDEKQFAVGTGGSLRSERDLNLGWVLAMPGASPGK